MAQFSKSPCNPHIPRPNPSGQESTPRLHLPTPDIWAPPQSFHVHRSTPTFPQLQPVPFDPLWEKPIPSLRFPRNSRFYRPSRVDHPAVPPLPLPETAVHRKNKASPPTLLFGRSIPKAFHLGQEPNLHKKARPNHISPPPLFEIPHPPDTSSAPL